MKLLKTITTAAMALSMTGLAQAQPTQTIIRIVGSTAYRNAAESVVPTAVVNSGITLTGSAWTGSAFVGANQANLSGTDSQGNQYIIKLDFTGSVSGIQTVLEQITPQTAYGSLDFGAYQFLSATASGSNASTGYPVDSGTTEVPVAAFSDVDQASTVYSGSTHLTDTPVGIVPFKWVASNGLAGLVTTGGTLNNITSEQIRVLSSAAANGTVPLSFFTGNSADAGVSVLATGRDNDSGTRITAFLDSKFNGATDFTKVLQYVGLDNNNVILKGNTYRTITSIETFPAETVNGVPLAEGQGGYNSGGNLAALMASTVNYADVGFNCGFITYLGLSDASYALSNGATELQYNGVPYSQGNVEQGKYSYWSYEHVVSYPGLTGITATFVQNLASAVINNSDDTQAGAGFKLSDLTAVQRASDSTVNDVTPVY